MEPKYYGVSEVILTPLAHHDDGCRLGNLQKNKHNVEVVKGQKDGELIVQMQQKSKVNNLRRPFGNEWIMTENHASR